MMLKSLAALWLGTAIGVAAVAAAPADRGWWNDLPYRPPPPNPKAAVMPLVSVNGNRFVTPDGKPILFRGVSIADPGKLLAEGQWKPELFDAVKNMGANLVRIPVHPTSWRAIGPKEYFEHLDEAVDWCTGRHMYVIIDWHSIGNLMTEMFQDPMYDTSKGETFDFWRRIAQHFNGNHTVAFFELFNEPTDYHQQLGDFSWTEWRNLNEEMIGIIRAFDPDTVPLVAGDDWAYDLDQVHYEPIRAANIGYVTHPYPHKRTRPWEPKWDEDFGFVSEKYPMIATEIGYWAQPGETITDDSYGNRITRYLERHGISWTAWVFDPQWDPALLKSFDGYPLTPCGEFFKEAMNRASEPVTAAAAPAPSGVGQLEAPGAAANASKDARLKVLPNGQMSLDGKVMADADLNAALGQWHQAHPDLGLVIMGDEDSEFKRIALALDVARLAGIRDFQLQTKSP
ncbi:MAG TPA: cellulase family glycosylhydrolase [Opitutaceae bacterium]|jgi:biopolymer transport protein ExbD